MDSCCFSILASDFHSVNQTKAANDIAIHIEEPLNNKVSNNIDFTNAILKNKKTFQGEHKVYFSIRKYKTRRYFDILTEISEHVTLVQLMDYLSNVNHAINVVGYWIFDSNYAKSLVLNRESLDIICAPSISEEQADTYEFVLCCEIHSHSRAKKYVILYIHQLNNLFIHYITRIKLNMLT